MVDTRSLSSAQAETSVLFELIGARYERQSTEVYIYGLGYILHRQAKKR